MFANTGMYLFAIVEVIVHICLKWRDTILFLLRIIALRWSCLELPNRTLNADLVTLAAEVGTVAAKRYDLFPEKVSIQAHDSFIDNSTHLSEYTFSWKNL